MSVKVSQAEDAPQVALSLEQTVRARHSAGHSQRAIAKDLNIGHRKVRRIIERASPRQKGHNVRMPARPEAASSGLPEWLQPSVLKLPMAEAESQLSQLVSAGERLKDWLKRTGNSNEVKKDIGEWRRHCGAWLDRNLGGQAAHEFKIAHSHKYEYENWDYDTNTSYRYLEENLYGEVAALTSIAKRLSQWAADAAPPSGGTTESPSYANSPKASSASKQTNTAPRAPIFIVHGHDTSRAKLVARIVEEATRRKAIILREEANLGQTLIEKFERHAAEASYAIVVLTPDDRGGVEGESNQSPRGRQNVIFEMGYFYGFLRRHLVSVLLYPGVEKPSDIDGIAYINFDDSGAWKDQLFRELEGAGFDVRRG